MNERINKIIALNQEAIHELELLKAENDHPEPEPEMYFQITEREPGIVIAEWSPELAEQYPDIDLYFYHPETHRPWQVTVRTEVPAKDMRDGMHTIPVTNREGEWLFQLRGDGYESEVIPYIYSPGSSEPTPEPGEKFPYWGLWDFQMDESQPRKSLYTDSEIWPFSIGRSASRSYLDRVAREGLLGQMHVGARLDRHSWNDIEKRLISIDTFAGSLSSEEIPLIHLVDEPCYKQTMYGDVEQMIRFARYAFKNQPARQFKYCFTVNQGHVIHALNNIHSGHPQWHIEPDEMTADYVQFQAYCWRNVNHPWNNFEDYFQLTENPTKAEFLEKFARAMERLRTLFPHSRFIIIGQSFYEGDGLHNPNTGTYENPRTNRYTKPNDEAPLWYAEAAAATPDVDGVLFWQRRNSGNWTGCDSEDFAGFRENLKAAYEKFVK